MQKEKIAEATHQGFTARLFNDGTISIFDGGVWAGEGRAQDKAWAQERIVIEDCAAVLPDEVYEALEAGLTEEIKGNE